MTRDASGNYTLPAGNPVESGTTISSTWANNTLEDLRVAVQDSLSRSGNGGMQAALKLVDGTVSAPGASFSNETSSGLYRIGSSNIGISVAGTKVADLSTSAIAFTATAITLNGVAATDFARLSQANTFTAGQIIKMSASNPSVQLWNTGASSGLQRWDIQAEADGDFSIFTRTDAGSAIENGIRITRNSSSEVTGVVLTADDITLNSVSYTDFARLSQANTFTAANTFSLSDNNANFIASSGTGRVKFFGYHGGLTVPGGFIQSRNAADDDYQDLTITAQTINLESTVSGLGGFTLNGIAASDFARKSQSNTFAAGQTITTADDTFGLKVAGASNKLRIAGSSSGNVSLEAVNAAESANAPMTLVGSSISLNGVSVTDYARLSQENTWTRSENGVSDQVFTNSNTGSSAGTRIRLTNDVGHRLEALMLGANFSGGFLTNGPTGEHAALWASAAVPLALGTNDTAALVISSSQNFDFKGGTVTTNNASAAEVGTKGAPSRDISASTNTAASDAGKTIRLTGGSGQTFTLDSDPPEDSVVVIDNASGNAWTIAASSSLVWAATGSTGSRTLANGGMAVALHQGAGVWKINGGGLS